MLIRSVVADLTGQQVSFDIYRLEIAERENKFKGLIVPAWPRRIEA